MMFTPAQVASNVIGIGRSKASLKVYQMILLGFLAGMFIALAAVASNTLSCTIESASVAKFAGAAVFPTGLAMCLLAGSELFTGNCLMIVSVLEKKVRIVEMLKNWIIVYLSNFVGSIFVACVVYFGGQFDLFGGALAVTTIKVAAAKTSLNFGKAILLGILCNFLVCIAVWISFAAKSIGSKLAGLFLPIMIFVGCGYEHSVANMYYISAGLLALNNPDYVQAASETVTNIGNLTVGNFLIANLLPVTIGNIIGGAVLVGVVYWAVYLMGNKQEN
jgi:formate/nitrite transporter